MPVCRSCRDEVDELFPVKVAGKARKVCEECADRLREAQEIGEESEAAMRDMMGYKGGW